MPLQFSQLSQFSKIALFTAHVPHMWRLQLPFHSSLVNKNMFQEDVNARLTVISRDAHLRICLEAESTFYISMLYCCTCRSPRNKTTWCSWSDLVQAGLHVQVSCTPIKGESTLSFPCLATSWLMYRGESQDRAGVLWDRQSLSSSLSSIHFLGASSYE